MKENVAAAEVQPKKNNKKRNYGRRIRFFILVGVIVYALITFFSQQQTIKLQKESNAKLSEQEEALQSEKEYYLHELDYIGSDSYIIKSAKEKLGWLFPDETKYVPTDSDSSLAIDMQEPAPEPTPEQTHDTSATDTAQAGNTSDTGAANNGISAFDTNTGDPSSSDTLPPLDEPDAQQ